MAGSRRIPIAPLSGSLARQPLLPVALDRRLRPDVGAFGVEAGGPARPALPEQVPALVQADRELTQALTVLAGESLANVALFQPVLLGQEPLDLGKHVSVVHGLSLCRRTMLALGPPGGALERLGGKEIKTTGDGFLATFTGPTLSETGGCEGAPETKSS